MRQTDIQIDPDVNGELKRDRELKSDIELKTD